jgi:altronate dehydratase
VKPALVISGGDNVATALEPLDVGRSLELAGHALVVIEHIPPGHKIALVDIAAGHPIVKYGSAIGVATAAILRGSHVHTHNVASGRGRGDLGRRSIEPDPGVRLAEPAEQTRDMTADVDQSGGSRD